MANTKSSHSAFACGVLNTPKLRGLAGQFRACSAAETVRSDYKCHQKQRYGHTEQPTEANSYNGHLCALPAWVGIHSGLELANLFLLLRRQA